MAKIDPKIKDLGSDLTSVEAKTDGITATGTATSPLHLDRVNDRVGIGTTDPLSPLHIQQSETDSNDDGIILDGAGQGSTRMYLSSSIFRIAKNGTDALAINNAGNVGIGTTDLGTTKLVVGQKPTTDSLVSTFLTSESGQKALGLYRKTTNVNGEVLQVYSDVGGTETKQLVIMADGAVGIGTTTPIYLLEVKDTTTAGAVAGFNNSGAGGTTVEIRNELANTAYNYITFKQGGGGTVGRIVRGSGSTIALANGSDSRIKTNIVTSTGSMLDKIAQLRLVNFQYTGTPETCLGVIAQELQAVFPEKVLPTDDGTGTSLPEGVEPWGVTQDFQFELLKAIQELKSENDAKQVQIDDLLTRVAALEA